MKNLIILLSLFILNAHQSMAQSGKIIFQVSDIQADKGGEVSVGVFTEADFPKDGKNFKGVQKLVSSSYMELSIDDIPQGTYGIAVYQDINQNKSLETNFIGFPKEPIGFSNDAPMRFGPPSFEDAAIEVKAGETTYVKLKLN